MFEQVAADSRANVISEQEFIKLCDDVYADRHQIYEFNPNVTRREAVMWMLLGCLLSLLSIPVTEQSNLFDNASTDIYTDALRKILQQHSHPPFDPQPHLAELSKNIEREEASATG